MCAGVYVTVYSSSRGSMTVDTVTTLADTLRCNYFCCNLQVMHKHTWLFLPHKHTHRFNGHFPCIPWLASCPLNSPSPFILCSTQTPTDKYTWLGLPVILFHCTMDVTALRLAFSLDPMHNIPWSCGMCVRCNELVYMWPGDPDSPDVL